MSESVFKEETKSAIKQKITEIQSHYLADKKLGHRIQRWKDSTVITQLVWPLDELPKKKDISQFVITTDTMVENPIVANWVENYLRQ